MDTYVCMYICESSSCPTYPHTLLDARINVVCMPQQLSMVTAPCDTLLDSLRYRHAVHELVRTVLHGYLVPLRTHV